MHSYSSSTTQKTPNQCTLNSCHFQTAKLSGLACHLELDHAISINYELLVFKSEIEFKQWKRFLEENTKSKYVQKCGQFENSSGLSVTRYYCNRSGYFTSNSTGARFSKSQGTSKINTYCTSTITVISSQTGLHVNYISTHVGHEAELCHLRLSSPEKGIIRGKLREGVSETIIHQQIVTNICASPKRIDLASMQDIRNQATKVCNKPWKRHPLDMLSLARWVNEELAKESDSQVIAFKLVGRSCTIFGIPLAETAFFLVLQSPTQSALLQKFGNNRPLLIDSTHNTNIAGYKLIVMMVIDLHNEGIPVAFCIAQQDNTEIVALFYRAVKSKSGNITPSALMSDDAPQFYNALIIEWNCTPAKLLCIWHVWRAWNRHTNTILEKGLRDLVKRRLRNIQAIHDLSIFQVKYLKII